ncbi:proline racemase family protein [Neobacillus sp. GCM10023253]|uniref:proline racemase family protein n=1 Tax=Neobacillus sp. GCM10023253 TaxID=3252644 RepID=UPI003615DCB9
MKIEKAYSTIDVHVAGEAFRIIRNAPFIHYQSLKELYELFPQAYKEEQTLLLNEPRGFAGLNGCLVVPPLTREADAAVVFFNHDGTMPIHYGGMAAVVTALLECGHLRERASNQYLIETVGGVFPITAVMKGEEVVSVKMESGFCEVMGTKECVTPSLANHTLVQSDQVYAVFRTQDFPVEIQVEELADLRRWGQTVLPSLSPDVKGAILVDESRIDEGHIRSITFRDDLLIVRSPGFGPTLAAFTSLLSSGSITNQVSLVNESIFGSQLQVQVLQQQESRFQYTMTCRGFITGMQTFILDPTDPLAAGFILK